MDIIIENVEQLHLSLDPIFNRLFDISVGHQATGVPRSTPAPAPESAGVPATSTASTTPPPVGTYWPEQGGVVAGLVRGEDGVSDYWLIVANGPEGATCDIAWSTGRGTTTATRKRDGAYNTAALTTTDGGQHPAAEWAAKLTHEGHSDWYLPSQGELAICCANVPEIFDKGWHWSSTQSSAGYAWYQYFDDGYQDDCDKSFEGRARAVRRFIP